ncbi:MAG: putative DNA-binding domain-containing protein [Gammaproteobacteria bacterium]|nr:putative DNA-binding domain-containing protein [Gammaproteobacteria bacterium]
MPARPQFFDLQYQFTAHMRDPERCPGPADVEDRRLGIYRELLYKNVEGFMSNAFPVLRSIIADEPWHAMIRDYFARHQARTALFPRMPQEFLQYLADERDDPLDPPFMRELAHYEWLEVEVSLDTRELDDSQVEESADLLDGCPVPNFVVRPQVYAFPVHRISPDQQPQTPPEEPTYLVVFRDRRDDVSFMELNAVSARLLDLILSDRPQSSRAMLEMIAGELKRPDPAAVIEGGRSILQMFVDKDIVLGFRKLAGR